MRAPESVRPAPAGPGNEPPKTSCLSVDGPENKLGEQAAQEATAALQRDFIAEALHVASIKAAHAADDVLLGEPIGPQPERGAV
jgi:hypothetical protein